jgi:hypothetical protein
MLGLELILQAATTPEAPAPLNVQVFERPWALCLNAFVRDS